MALGAGNVEGTEALCLLRGGDLDEAHQAHPTSNSRPGDLGDPSLSFTQKETGLSSSVTWPRSRSKTSTAAQNT